LIVEDETESFSIHSSLKYSGTIHNASYSALSTDNIIFGKVFSQTHIEKTLPRFNKESLWGM